MTDWTSALGEVELKELMLRNDRFFSIFVNKDSTSENMIGQFIRDIKFPEKCLAVLLSRGGEIIIPGGATEIYEDDRLTIVGEPESIKEAKSLYLC